MSKKRVKKKPKRIVYQPPSIKEVNDFAREVCSRLAAVGDTSYSTPEVVGGFAKFLNIAAVIISKDLNKLSDTEEKVDNQSE